MRIYFNIIGFFKQLDFEDVNFHCIFEGNKGNGNTELLWMALRDVVEAQGGNWRVANPLSF